MDMDDLKQTSRPEYSLDDALAALKAADETAFSVPAPVFYGLSDLPPASTERFLKEWRTLADGVRTHTARQLLDTAEASFEFRYENVAQALLGDPLPQVRQIAVELLWENKDVAVMERLRTMLQSETVDGVKVELLNALGRYLLLGEYEDIPTPAASRAQETVLSFWNKPDESLLVRRRALEAVANSSHKNLREMIQKAYDSRLHDMRVSALYAMGRSCDTHWKDKVLAELNSEDPEMRYEAARASGQIELDEALPVLVRLAAQPDDIELQHMSIWAIGEIGGEEATQYLQGLSEALDDDDDLQNLIEDAIHNAQLRLDLDVVVNDRG